MRKQSKAPWLAMLLATLGVATVAPGCGPSDDDGNPTTPAEASPTDAPVTDAPPTNPPTETETEPPTEVPTEVPTERPPAPAVTITAPADNAPVPLQGDLKLEVTTRVRDFTLAAPGACGGAELCGHLHLNLDGDAGNADGAPYNAASGTTTIIADFSLLDEAEGEHTLTVSLRNDDHSPVIDAQGNEVKDEITVIATVTPVTLNISAQLDDATLTLGTDVDQSVAIPYAVTGFTLGNPDPAAADACDPDDDYCGHVHLLIDGNDGNASGLPYNNAGYTNTIDAKFGLLENPEGLHVITMILVHSDHTPMEDADGNPVMDEVSVTTVAPNPTLAIGTPLDGDRVVLIPQDPNKAVSVTYRVTDFTLAEPGACPSTEVLCGHIHVNVDGDAGNADGLPYNNAGASNPIDANLAELGDGDAPYGQHTITLQLMYDDHKPVKNADGQPIISEVTVIAQKPNEPTLVINSPAQGSTNGLEDDGMALEVGFRTTSFQLADPSDPNGCDGATGACGHVHLRIDGDEGNKPGLPYNNAGFESPILADFSVLDEPYGGHVITLSLHNPDHSPVILYGEPVEANLLVQTERAVPSIAIQGVKDGDLVRLGTDPDLSASFAFTANYITLAAPGNCPPQAPVCGHVVLQIDGDDGNQDGQEYNNVGNASPIAGLFVYADPSDGEHQVTLQLMQDNGSPLLVDGKPVKDTVTVITEMNDEPFIRIVAPAEGAEVTLDPNDLTANVVFTTANFVLKAPGECVAADGENCGHVHLNLDGNAGNVGGAPYNNAGATSPITADFGALDSAEGEHTITLSLRYDDHSPVILASGEPAEWHVHVSTVLGE